jgi:integrase
MKNHGSKGGSEVAAHVGNRLKDRRVKSAKGVPGKQTWLPDGQGLYLRIGPTGAKSWVFRYSFKNHRHDLGLGSYPIVSLDMARQYAEAQRRLYKVGDDRRDPLAVRIQRNAKNAKVPTFRQLGELYIDVKGKKWSDKSRQQWAQSLADYAYPTIGETRVDLVDKDMILGVLRPIWETRNVTAGRLRARIERVLEKAKADGYRDDENPARWSNLEHSLADPRKRSDAQHFAAMPYKSLPTFMGKLRANDGIDARALELVILTAARSGDVIGARWSEIRLDERLWVIPAARYKKGKKEHRIALSGAAVAIFEKMAAVRQNQFVFPGVRTGRPIGPMSLRRVLAGITSDHVDVHGFRSSFRDWVAEKTDFPGELAELALGHNVGSEVERAYRRSDMFQKRLALAEAWANYCAGQSRRARAA